MMADTLQRQNSQPRLKKLKCMLSNSTNNTSSMCTRTKSNASINSNSSKKSFSLFKRHNTSSLPNPDAVKSLEEIDTTNNNSSSTSNIIAPVAPQGWQVRFDPALKQYYYVHLFDSFVQLDHPDEVVKRDPSIQNVKSSSATTIESEEKGPKKAKSSSKTWSLFKRNSSKSLKSMPSFSSPLSSSIAPSPSDSAPSSPLSNIGLQTQNSFVSTINTLNDSFVNPLTPHHSPKSYHESEELFNWNVNESYNHNNYSYDVENYYDEPIQNTLNLELEGDEEDAIDYDSLYSFIFNGKDEVATTGYSARSSYELDNEDEEKLSDDDILDLDRLRAKMACENYFFTRERFNEV